MAAKPEPSRESLTSRALTRRRVLGLAGLGAAHLCWSATLGARRAFAVGTARTIDRQPWGTLQELAEGVWAVISTPAANDDWTTTCNGGLIAGRERVLAVEAYLRPEGARWLGEQARRLAGRWPTDVLISHFHGDHVNGLEGFHGEEPPAVHMTATTRGLIRQADSGRIDAPSPTRESMLEGARILSEEAVTRLDLGGRTVTLRPRRGHTPSDVFAELDEPGVIFAGDLIWNGVFPNYRDTEPSAFSESIRSLLRERETIYVSGHGTLAERADVDRLLRLVEAIGEAARRAHERGIPLAEAAAAFSLPAEVSDWTLFNPKYFEVAFKAWYEELGQ